MDAAKYDAEQIQVLKGLEPVHRRPGMFIGSTDITGLHHLVWEVVDNSVDEAMAGHCNLIEVVIHQDNSVMVRDNGRGIPVKEHAVTKRPAVETVLTTLHAGGKFGGESGYKVSGGLHGVGVSVVNALSRQLRVRVKREGKSFVQDYERGVPMYDLKSEGKADGTGTEVTFWPDTNVFGNLEFSFETVKNRLRQQAYLTKCTWIVLIDERSGDRAKFYFEGGVKSFVKHLNKNRNSLDGEPFYMEQDEDEGQLAISLQYTDSYQERIFTFANNIHTVEGGAHLVGFRTSLTRTLNNYAKKAGLAKDKDANLTGDDVREGITAVISVRLKEPQFEGQTKAKLGNAEIRTAVERVFGEKFQEYLDENPNSARLIFGKCALSARARLAARAARDTVIRKGALEGITLPGKLADCSSKTAADCELFIVEGDSAGGSAKQGRNRQFQAILPLKGKILNTERARLDRIISSTEVKALIVALGTSIGEGFDIRRLRYNRIVLMTDADVDGAHIRTLLLTFFYRYLEPIVIGGHLFIAQPPLYRIEAERDVRYLYNDSEKEEFLGTIAGKKYSIQRYKGLGEMNPQQLWETTMDPDKRRTFRVTIEDAEKADMIFETLMGDEVQPRKKFIQTHAKRVKNLDI